MKMTEYGNAVSMYINKTYFQNKFILIILYINYSTMEESFIN